MHRTTSQGTPATPRHSHRDRALRPHRREDIDTEGSMASATRSTQSGLRFGTRYSQAGSIHSLSSSPAVPSYMQATQSARAKVRPLSQPQQSANNPGSTPEKDGWGYSAKKRLSFPISEHLINNSGSGSPVMKPFRPNGYAVRSPSFKGIRVERSSAASSVRDDSGSQNGDVGTPTSTVVSTCRAPF